MNDPVARACDAVDAAEFMFVDGRQLPQTSRPELIADILRLADLEPAHRVLEVGTGSGYSTALIAHLVGAAGQVVSLDIDPEVTARASGLFAGPGWSQVEVHCADGRDGWPAAVPFDVVIAWASSAGAIPPVWPAQTREGGRIVAPVREPGADLVIAWRVEPGGTLHRLGELAAGFIPLTATPYHPWKSTDDRRP